MNVFYLFLILSSSLNPSGSVNDWSGPCPIVNPSFQNIKSTVTISGSTVCLWELLGLVVVGIPLNFFPKSRNRLNKNQILKVIKLITCSDKRTGLFCLRWVLRGCLCEYSAHNILSCLQILSIAALNCSSTTENV